VMCMCVTRVLRDVYVCDVRLRVMRVMYVCVLRGEDAMTCVSLMFVYDK
jgi:hypothetical protein